MQRNQRMKNGAQLLLRIADSNAYNNHADAGTYFTKSKLNKVLVYSR